MIENLLIGVIIVASIAYALLVVGLRRWFQAMEIRPDCSADHPCRNKWCKYCGIPDPDVPHYRNGLLGGDDGKDN